MGDSRIVISDGVLEPEPIRARHVVKKVEQPLAQRFPKSIRQAVFDYDDLPAYSDPSTTRSLASSTTELCRYAENRMLLDLVTMAAVGGARPETTLLPGAQATLPHEPGNPVLATAMTQLEDVFGRVR